MTDDVRAIDDAEALKVWSELSELDPKLRGDTYVTEDGSKSVELRCLWKWAQLESEQQKLKLTTAKGRLEQKPQTRARTQGQGDANTLLTLSRRSYGPTVLYIYIYTTAAMLNTRSSWMAEGVCT
eukprot:5730874-Amphidinium_carterae.1